jgi:hypothetical protein
VISLAEVQEIRERYAEVPYGISRLTTVGDIGSLCDLAEQQAARIVELEEGRDEARNELHRYCEAHQYRLEKESAAQLARIASLESRLAEHRAALRQLWDRPNHGPTRAAAQRLIGIPSAAPDETEGA